jgi:CheY-like chemotaxis protein
MNCVASILLAEDDDNDIFFLQRAFQAAGVENPLRVVKDGQEAIEYLAASGNYTDRAQHPLPCLLILDLKMPRKTGMDVLQWKHDQPVLKTVPSIVLSSSAHRHDIERAYRLGANGFVVKPQSVDTRTALARFIKGFWLEFNQPPLACIEGIEEAMKLYTAMEVPPSFF